MRLSSYRSVAVTLALCAMVLRALLPDGWMPAAAGSPAPFTICALDGIHSGGKAPAKHERSQAPCPFAAAAPLSLHAAPPISVTAPMQFEVAAFLRNDRAPLRRTLPTANAPRAPPVFS
jgi:hypothetical protein